MLIPQQYCAYAIRWQKSQLFSTVTDGSPLTTCLIQETDSRNFASYENIRSYSLNWKHSARSSSPMVAELLLANTKNQLKRASLPWSVLGLLGSVYFDTEAKCSFTGNRFNIFPIIVDFIVENVSKINVNFRVKTAHIFKCSIFNC